MPQSINNKSIITGRGPVATFMDYQLELISFTKGTGKISLNFDGYDECHNLEESNRKIQLQQRCRRRIYIKFDILLKGNFIFC